MKRLALSFLEILLGALALLGKNYASVGTFDATVSSTNGNDWYITISNPSLQLDWSSIGNSPSQIWLNQDGGTGSVYSGWTYGGCPASCHFYWQAGINSHYIVIFDGTNYLVSNTMVEFITTAPPPTQLGISQLASNGNGYVTFQIQNPPPDFDFSSSTAAGSWDNSTWAYALLYKGGCPSACEIEWTGAGLPFYIKLTHQNSSIIFNEPVNGGAYSIPYTQFNLQQLSSDGTGKVTFQILSPPQGFDFSSLSSAGGSSDNSTWVYAISYEGGCPNACVVNWPSQTSQFYVKLANQTSSIIFNQSVSPALNSSPSITIPVPSPINEGDTYSAIGSFTDADSTSWTATVEYGDGGGILPLNLSGKNFSLSHTYTTPGVYIITVSVMDNLGKIGTQSTTVLVNDVAPVISFSFIPNGLNGWFTTSPAAGTVTATTLSTGSTTIASLTCDEGTLSNIAGLGTHTVSGTLFVHTQGTNTVSCTAIDNIGIATTQQATINLDTTPPTCTVVATPNHIWPPNKTLVAVTETVIPMDLISGLPTSSFILQTITNTDRINSNDYPGFVLGTPATNGQLRTVKRGAVYTLTYQVKDNAGLTNTCQNIVSVSP